MNRTPRPFKFHTYAKLEGKRRRKLFGQREAVAMTVRRLQAEERADVDSCDAEWEYRVLEYLDAERAEDFA